MRSARSNRYVHVLLVGDNLGDVRRMQEALKAGNMSVSVSVVESGDRAMASL
jgi:hypothetical protein